MSDEFVTQQTEQPQFQYDAPQQNMGEYQDPIAPYGGVEPKKKSGASKATTIGATVASILVVFLFGVIGGLICYGGYWAVYAVLKSKLPTAAKVTLSVILIIVFVALLLAFIIFASALRASL